MRGGRGGEVQLSKAVVSVHHIIDSINTTSPPSARVSRYSFLGYFVERILPAAGKTTPEGGGELTARGGPWRTGGGRRRHARGLLLRLEAESVCWPLGSLRFASIFDGERRWPLTSLRFASTAWGRVACCDHDDEQPFVPSWSTATHSTLL